MPILGIHRSGVTALCQFSNTEKYNRYNYRFCFNYILKDRQTQCRNKSRRDFSERQNTSGNIGFHAEYNSENGGYVRIQKTEHFADRPANIFSARRCSEKQ